MSIFPRRDVGPDLRTLQDIRAELDALRRWVRNERRALYLRKFRPDQLRVPRGDPGAGRWADEGGDRPGAASPRIQRVSSDSPNPGKPPNRSDERSRRQREISNEVRRQRAEGVPLDGLRLVLDGLRWGPQAIAEIIANADPPKDLEELLNDAARPQAGYQLHHIVEQTTAYRDGYDRGAIEASDNIVRIPTLKHYQISGWYSKPNVDFGGLSPREYLRGKSWDERVSVGLGALRNFGAMK